MTLVVLLGVISTLLVPTFGSVLKENVTQPERGASLISKRAPDLLGDPNVHADWDHAPFKNPDVTKKYTDVEGVSNVLFVIACKSKHKNDVDGLARAAAQKGNFDEEAMADFVKNLQEKNLQEMKGTCGKVNVKSTAKCNAGCTSKWSHPEGGVFKLVDEKRRCSDTCEVKHRNWEKECNDKAQTLGDIYLTEQGQMQNTAKCQQLHCNDFPAVLMMKDDEAEDAKKDGCKELCTEKFIKARCVKKWGLAADMQAAAVQGECRTKVKDEKLTPCVDEGTGKADEDHVGCNDDGHKLCTDKEKECKDKAEATAETSMVHNHAESICKVRKIVCFKKEESKCEKKHKKALTKMQTGCIKETKEASKDCYKKEYKKSADKFKKDCFDEIEPTCRPDCEDRCKIPDMRKCQEDHLKAAFGATAQYCQGLWEWIFDSEEFDSKTMDPIPKSVGGGRFSTETRLLSNKDLEAK